MRFASFAGLVLLLTACQSSGKHGCPAKQTEVPIMLGGDFQLRGTLALEPAQDGLRVTLRSTETADKGPQVVLDGVGECSNGIVRARFGGGADVGRKDLTVLGAELEGLFEPKLNERRIFAAWTVDLVEGTARRRAKGFLWHDPGDV